MQKAIAYLKRVLLYSNMDRGEFYRNYANIKSALIAENRQSLNVFSALASCLFAVMTVASLALEDLASYRVLYVVMLVFCATVFFTNKNAPYRNTNEMRLSIYSFALIAFIFAAIMGTVYSPSELSVTYMALIIAAPLAFVDKPRYFVCLSTISYVIFIILVLIHKDPECIVTDIVDGAVFTLFAIISCVYLMNTKLQKLMLEYNVEMASNTDVLTGLYNRRRYVLDLDAYDNSKLNDTYFIYADANGLHELNDEFGHEAGDKLLITLAEVLRNHFGEKVYRIGGDEFVAFGSVLSEQELQEKMKILSDEITERGYSASIGYQMGSTADSMNELMRIAETKMYEAKAAYYSQTGHDRRSASR